MSSTSLQQKTVSRSGAPPGQTNTSTNAPHSTTENTRSRTVNTTPNLNTEKDNLIMSTSKRFTALYTTQQELADQQKAYEKELAEFLQRRIYHVSSVVHSVLRKVTGRQVPGRDEELLAALSTPEFNFSDIMKGGVAVSLSSSRTVTLRRTVTKYDYKTRKNIAETFDSEVPLSVYQMSDRDVAKFVRQRMRAYKQSLVDAEKAAAAKELEDARKDIVKFRSEIARLEKKLLEAEAEKQAA